MSEDLIISDDRPIRYVETDESGRVTVVYRASALGGCPRALVAAGTGIPPRNKPEWFEEVLNEGKRMEPHILAAVEALGLPTTRQQERVELEVGQIDGKRVIVRGSIDGARGFDKVLREAKKFRESTWHDAVRRGVECRPTYPWQVASYMHAGGFDECEFVCGQYDAKTDSISEIYVHDLASPPIPLKAIKLRVANIERLINQRVNPAQVPCCEPLMYPCPYYTLHDEPELREITDEGIIELVVEIRKITDECNTHDRLAKEKREVKGHLVAELRRQIDAPEGTKGKVKAGDFTVSWSVGDRDGYTVEPKKDVSTISVKVNKSRKEDQ